MKVLITGGAGFIGTHLARRLLRENCDVTIFDNFSRQIHGDQQHLSSDLKNNVHLVIGDVRDRNKFSDVLAGQDVVVHLAAETGTGQSMYEIIQYEDVNIKGTAVLLDCLINDKSSRLKKIVVASSRAIYGEGKYECPSHGIVYPPLRKTEEMKAGYFETVCPLCRVYCKSLPTDEISKIQPVSFYGLTKQMQEQMVFLFAKILGISAYALRYQNIYGPGQSLKNPYTGVLAIFSNRASRGEPIYIFEDGLESRDFVYVEDAVDATWRCIGHDGFEVQSFNVGSGERTTILEVAREIISFFGKRSDISITGAFREGDIRHNLADLTKVKDIIGFVPQWKFHSGISEFLSWVVSQPSQGILYEQSLKEMRDKRLMHG